jgi:D-alanine-D-alanine ligase
MRPLSGDTSSLDVVLVADRRDFSNDISLSDRYLEFTEPDYFEELFSTLTGIARSLTYYEHPRDLLDNIQKHRRDVVLSVWSGEASRNRRGLVPSICEAYSIRYVGADAFAHLVCADKTLSKVFSRRYGLGVPEGALLVAGDPDRQFDAIECLRFPLMVKPNAEGGSIGISVENVVDTFTDASRLARDLLRHYPTVVAEEFISGREVSIILAGNREEIYLDDVLEVEVENGSGPLADTVLGWEHKNYDGFELRQVIARELVPEQTRRAARALFRGLGKVEVIRIDGRISGGEFKVIELSPDAHLGSICLVGAAFEAAGLTYPQMLETLLLNAATG